MSIDEPVLGFGTAVGLGLQTDYATAVSRTAWCSVLPGVTLAQTVAKAQRECMADFGAGRVRRSHFIKEITAGGTLPVYATYEGLGLLLHACLGTKTTTGASSPYAHAYSPAMELPALTAEFQRGTAGSELYTGLMASKGVIKVEKGKPAIFTLDTIARSCERDTAVAPVWTTSRDRLVMFDEAGSLAWNGLTIVTNMVELSLDNKLSRRFANGSRYTSKPNPGVMDVTLRVETDEISDDLWNAFTTDDVDDAEIEFEDADGRKFNILLKDAYIETYNAPMVLPGPVKETLLIRGQASSTSEGLVVTVTNTQSGSVAA